MHKVSLFVTLGLFISSLSGFSQLRGEQLPDSLFHKIAEVNRSEENPKINPLNSEASLLGIIEEELIHIDEKSIEMNEIGFSPVNFETHFDQGLEGVTFKVQIIASTTKFSSSDVQKKLNLAEEIFHEYHEGLNKYLIGSFSTYQLAKEKCELVKKGYRVNSFIVGYLDNQRVNMNQIFRFQ